MRSSPNILRLAIFFAIFASIALAPFIASNAASIYNPLRAINSTTAKSVDLGTVADYKTATKRTESIIQIPESNQFLSFASLLQASNSITLFEGDCSTPATEYELGDTVCVRVAGVSLGANGRVARRVNFVSRAGTVVQTFNVTTDPQDFTFTLPGTNTTTYPDQEGEPITVDNRGKWRVTINSVSENNVYATRYFDVKAQTPYVNLRVEQGGSLQGSQVAAGSGGAFDIFVTNDGPNDASNVTVTDIIPNDTTNVTLTEVTALGFTCGTPDMGAVSCSIASLPKGAAARFTLQYEVSAGASANTEISNTVNVSSQFGTDPINAAELDMADNTSTTGSSVPGTAPPASCSLTCRDNMVVTANTTQGGNPGAFVTFGATTSNAGDCGAINVSPASGSFFTVGTTIVSVSSTTGGGSCTFTITVVDTPAPTISCPPDQTVADNDQSGEETVNVGTPTTTPSTGVTVVGVRSDSTPAVLDANGDVVTPAQPKPLTDPYPVGTTTITWTVTDAHGRTASCNQRITVTTVCAGDTTAPTITAPADITVGTGADANTCGVSLDGDELGQEVADDDCSVTVTVSGIPAGNVFPIGTTTLTYTATDGSGHTATDTQTVTVVDDTKPLIEAPADASYTCLSEVPAASASQATRGDVFDDNGNLLPPAPPYDNCGVPVVTITETSTGAGSAASPRVITRVFKATDASGNFTEDTQVITVTDPTAPTITAPADVTVSNDPDACSATGVALGTATTADNCTVASVTNDAPASFPVGQTTVTWTVTDWAGNQSTDTQVVTVNDTQKPVITTGGDVTVYLPLNSPATSMVVNYTAATATDNCPGAINITYSHASGAVYPVGTTVVTVTATDVHNNTQTATFNVTVLYNFTGFFSPVGNLPILNQVNAGRAIPVKFSLSGNKGLGIFVTGSPSSGVITCDANATPVDVTETVTAGGSTLTYSPDQYSYIWKTESSWAGTCRQLVLTLNDGSIHRANFKFK